MFFKKMHFVIFIAMVGTGLFPANAQTRDTSTFHFQIPVGAQYLLSSSWKPYQSSFVLGISGMLGMKNKNLSLDWGFLTGYHAGVEDFKSENESGSSSAFLQTGSETITLYAGLGQRWRTGKNFLQYAGGLTYCHAELTPFQRSVIQKQSSLGGYLRGAMQYSISPSTLLGPFLAVHFYPANDAKKTKLNPSLISIGLTIGPSF